MSLITMQKYGFTRLNAALKKANNELIKAWTNLIRKIAKEGARKARELAPRSKNPNGDHYYRTIKHMVVSRFRARVYSERYSGQKTSIALQTPQGMTYIKRNRKKTEGGKGYLAGILEYGRKTYRPMAPRPHLEKAVAWAIEQYKGEVEQYFNGIMGKALAEFGGKVW